MTIRRLTPRSCVLCLALACSRPDTPPAPFATTVDGAGVLVATSSVPSWTPADEWLVDSAARVGVGAADGDEEYLVSWIWDAMLLRDGTLVVGNAGGHDLRFYDHGGRFVRRAGRKGAGPGEFGEFSDLRMWRLPGGELAVRDAPLPRLNVFDSTGSFRRTVILSRPDSAARPTTVGAFADGTFLVLAWEPQQREVPGQPTWNHVRYFHYDGNGRALATLLRLEAAPHLVHQVGGVTHYPYMPFAMEPLVAADSNSVLVLKGGEPVIERYDLAGRLTGRITWSPARRRATADIYRRLAAADIASVSDPQQKRLWENYYELDLPLPESVPAYRSLYVDELRHLWVERYRLPWEVDRVWDVIAPDGRWLGPVTLPGRFWLHRAGRGFLVGTRIDSLDVERVQVHDLLRRVP